MRPARIQDAEALRTFFLQSWKESGPGALGFTGATDAAINEIASESFLIERLSSPKVKIIVAESGGRVIGFASIRKTDNRDGELSGIVVLEGETGKGLGTQLVKKAFVMAARLGLVRLFVKTESFNMRAIGFYEKNGFTRTTKTTEKVGRTKVPTQVLEKRLH